MSDTRSLVFPMTARDVVVSVQLVGVEMRGDGPQTRIYEVIDVIHVGTEEQLATVQIVCKNPHGGGLVTFEFEPDTALLISGIRRR